MYPQMIQSYWPINITSSHLSACSHSSVDAHAYDCNDENLIVEKALEKSLQHVAFVKGLADDTDIPVLLIQHVTFQRHDDETLNHQHSCHHAGL